MSSPSTSLTNRSASHDALDGLDGLARVVLQGETRPEHDPIEATRPSQAPRARLAVAIAASRKRADHHTERSRALELGRQLIDGFLDMDRGVRLWRRALTLEFDPRIQRELARRLRMLGRHREAGDLLRSGETIDEDLVASALRAAAHAYAAAGDGKAAASALREAANLQPTSPDALSELAAIHAWNEQAVTSSDASLALTQAASRCKTASAGASTHLARAFDASPENSRAAQDFTNLLRSQERFAAADIVWRRHARKSKTVDRIAAQRVETALGRDDPALALLAALDGCIDGPSPNNLELLCRVLEHDSFRSLISGDSDVVVKLTTAATIQNAIGRASSLASIAESLSGKLCAVVLSLAAEAFLAAGNEDRAVASATEACAEAPQLAHPHAVLLEIAAESTNLPAQLLERSLALLPASSHHYRVAANHFERAGRPRLALAYTRRWYALRPADESALSALLRQAIAVGGTDAISHAVQAACEAPMPLIEVAAELQLALEELMMADSSQAAEVARRVLETVGATEEMLWPTLHAVASRAEDESLLVNLLCGRACDTDLPTHRAAELRLSVATHLCSNTKWQAAAEHLRQAARFNVDDDAVEQLLGKLREQRNASSWSDAGDGILAIAHTAAMLAERRSEPDADLRWRELGALRWDLAQHGEGAEDAFFRALKHVGDEGPFQYLSDVIGRLGAERGLELAMSRTERSAGHRDQSSQAELLTCIARRALEDSQQEAALTAALRALELTPNAPQVPLAIIECLWAHPRAADVIERAFKVIEKNAIGKVGRMTARHRAERWRSWLQGEEGSVPPPRKSSANLAETATAGPSTEPTRVVELPEHSLRGLVWGDAMPSAPAPSRPKPVDSLRRLAWGSRPPPESEEVPPSEPPPDSDDAPASSRPGSYSSVALSSAGRRKRQKRSEPPPSSRPPSSIPPSSGSPERISEPVSSSPFGFRTAPSAEYRRLSSLPPSSTSAPPTYVAFAPKAENAEEETLLEQLTSGSFDAGEQLVEIYEKDNGRRNRDIVAVRRHQATLRRGERNALLRLRDAAKENREAAYTLCIEQVIAVLEGESALPPALSALVPQPAVTTAMLTSDLQGTVNEALSIVWQSGLLRREVSDYELSGVDRVPIGSSTTVGKIFSEVSALTDFGGVRMFHRKNRPGALEASVALLNPLAAVIDGAAKRDTRTLRYRIGEAMVAATAPLALSAALPETELNDLLAALRTGFGPVGRTSAQNITARQMRIAQDLWQLVSPDNERRLRQICEDVTEIGADQARDNMMRIRRRVGLFASGDLYVALTETLNALDVQGGMNRLRAGDRDLWNQPALAELFDLAVSPQYAVARWRILR